jgi:imidazolonepropionase-like amidohydrolase
MERNLPYEAAEAVAWGLDPEEAIKMITLYPAQILGIDDRVGSLETGKDATFIVTDGNPLDIRTNVVRAFVQGREIDLSSRHTDLNDKYAERLRQLTQSP